MLGAGAVLSAETIVLKNGRHIVADTALEVDGRVQYEIGDNSYSIPKTIVDHIESGGAPGVSNPAVPKDVPDFTPRASLAPTGELPNRVIRDGRIDFEVLKALDSAGDPENAAAGYFIAAHYEHEHGNRDKAIAYLRTALTFLPENAILLGHYAAELVQVGRSSEAVSCAEHAVRLMPNSPDTLTVLGFAYIGADRTSDALRVWKKALAIRPDADLSKFMEKAGREVSVEADFQQRESGHFTIKYEGKQVSEALGRSILDTLDRDYDDLVRDLGVTPRTNIGVVLYTEKAFFDVTQSPGWMGAVNDGKIRIPIEGITSMTPALSHVLKHELAHSFITQVTRGRCPLWLHEGVAQFLEGRTTSGFGKMLAKVYAQDKQVPLRMLEHSFANFSSWQATVAYSESLAAAEYISSTYGLGDLRMLLERIGEGSSAEAALRSTVHSGYSDLEIEIGRYLKNKYGS